MVILWSGFITKKRTPDPFSFTQFQKIHFSFVGSLEWVFNQGTVMSWLTQMPASVCLWHRPFDTRQNQGDLWFVGGNRILSYEFLTRIMWSYKINTNA
jgi:hypothetical protein